RIDRSDAGRDGDVDARIGRRQVRIAAQVVVGQDVVPHRIAVVAAEPVAPVVAAAAVLRLTALQVDLAGVGLDAKIATANVHDLAGLERLDLAAAVAVGAVDPVVQAPDEAVDAVLLVALGEAGVEDDLLVGLAGAFGVLGVEDVGSAGDEDA